MDKNNTPTEETPPAASETVAPTPVPESPPTSGLGGNKKVLWLVIGLVVIALVAIGLYFYMNQNKAQQTNQTSVQTTQVMDSFDKDLQVVAAEETDDLSTIDQDLQNL